MQVRNPTKHFCIGLAKPTKMWTLYWVHAKNVTMFFGNLGMTHYPEVSCWVLFLGDWITTLHVLNKFFKAATVDFPIFNAFPMSGREVGCLGFEMLESLIFSSWSFLSVSLGLVRTKIPPRSKGQIPICNKKSFSVLMNFFLDLYYCKVFTDALKFNFCIIWRWI